MRDRCPFCTKLAIWIAEAQLAQYFTIEYDTPENREFVTGLAGKASFPALETEPGKVMLESDDIRDFIAAEAGVDMEASCFVMRDYYVNGIFTNYMSFWKYASEKEGGAPATKALLAAARADMAPPPAVTQPGSITFKITYLYWPPVGRGFGLRYMLEASGVGYNRDIFSYGEEMPCPQSFAVPAVKHENEWLSQSMVILPFTAELVGYNPPPEKLYVCLRAMHNINDWISENLDARSKIKTKTAAKEQVSGERFHQWLHTIEATFAKSQKTAARGPYFLGDTPTFVDFELAGKLQLCECMYGSIGDQLAKYPKITAARDAVVAMAGVRRFIESGFNGESPIDPPRLASSLEG